MGSYVTMGDSAYSFSLTTFSRTGKLLQIEYALNAVANGRTSLGICAKDGVVIATDKKLTSELVDISDVHKVELLTPSCGVCYSGVGPDFRVLVHQARKSSQVYLRLYQVDPSGTYFSWKATAIGKNYVNAKNFLEKRYTEDMELEDAIHTALLTLREGFEGEMNSENIEVGVVRNGKFSVLSPEQIQDYLDEAN